MYEEIIKTATQILTTALLTIGLVGIEYLRRYLKKKADSTDNILIESIANQAVSAAAQIGKIGNLDNVDKKRKAVDIFKSLASNVGIKLSETDISNILESAYIGSKYYLDAVIE